MTSARIIDINFDFKTETKHGEDADAVSPTLRLYHSLLWSKPLASRGKFIVAAPAAATGAYLRGVTNGLASTRFGSDTITHSYSTWMKPKPLVAAIASLDEAQRSKYLFPRYTVGSAMIWPIRMHDKPTINQARGTRSVIADRIDLTLECIRRHYAEERESPLADVLHSYRDFFAIFEGFSEFVEFFHFQSLVSPDFSSVNFFLPCENFSRPGTPASVGEYVTYREATLRFIAARQQLIQDWADAHLQPA